MSVELIDVDDAPSTTQPSEEDVTLDSVVPPVEEAPQEATPSSEEPQPNLPEKYRDKSVEDIIEMHQNAEKMIGRSSSEVGELRKIVDDFITSQSTQEQPPEEEIDFFADPKQAVTQAIENHPAVKEAKQASEAVKAREKAAQAEAALLERHPDANEILGNPEFQQRLQKSPLMQQAINNAAKNTDVEAMSAVFDEWKANKPVAQENTTTPSQQQQVKQASTGAVRAGAGESRKLYRRTDIIDLMVNDPDRYERLLPEIEAAYREKRVVT